MKRDKMKKLLMTFLVLLLIIPPFSVTQAQSTPEISIPEGEIWVDSLPAVVGLPVLISNVTNVTGVDLNISFDPNVLQLTEIIANESYFTNLSIWAVDINNSLGIARVALVANDSMTTEEAKPFLDLNFTAISSGSSPVNITFAEISLEDFNVTTDVIRGNGSITIHDETPPVLSFVKDTPDNHSSSNETSFWVNVSSNEVLQGAYLHLQFFNGTSWGFWDESSGENLGESLLPMISEDGMFWSAFVPLSVDAILRYWVNGSDLAGNDNSTEVRYLNLSGYPPLILYAAPPEVLQNSPANISVLLYDATPSHYKIFRNGSLVDEGTYQPFELFNVSIDTSQLGTFEYTIWANDTFGNENETSFIVEVISGVPEAFYFEIHGNARELWNASYENVSVVEIADLNGDGAEDVIFATRSGGEELIASMPTSGVIYALNGATGEEMWNVSISEEAYYLKADDVDGDGYRDVIFASDHYVGAIENDGSGFLILYTNDSISYFSEENIYAVDVDGDGFKELATIGETYDGSNYILMVIDSGFNNLKWSRAFESWSMVIASNEEKEPPVKIANVAKIQGYYQNFNFDFNKDGKGDLLLISSDGNILALNGENGNTIWNKTYEGWMELYSKVDDLNGDGVKELLFEYVGGDGYTIILNGATGEELWNSTQRLISGCFDYDGDGACEFMTYDGDRVYMRSSNGNVEWNSTFGSYENVWTLKGSVIVLGRNYDWQNETVEIKVVKFDNNGTPLWTFEKSLDSYIEYHHYTTTDLTGDGIKDVLLTDWWGYNGLAIDGNTGTELWSIETLKFKYIGDFDGDEKGDIFNFTSPAWSAKSGEGLTGDTLAYIFNVSSSDPFEIYESWSDPFAIYDLNGDNLNDMLFIVNRYSPDSKLYAVVAAQPPVQKPDLTVSMEVPTMIKVNEQFQINLTAKNIGTAQSPQTTLNLYIDDSLVHTFSVGPLSPGETQEFTHQYTFASEGLHLIRAVIDPSNNVDELKEDNNETAWEVIVSKPKPDLIGILHVFDEFGNETDVLKIHKAGDSWRGNTYNYPFVVVNVSFEIRNLNPDTTVDSIFTLTGTYKDHSFNYEITQEQLNDLNADGVLYINDTAVVNASGIDVGCYTFNISVDADDRVEETDEDNNNASYTLCLSQPDLVPILEIPDELVPGTHEFTVGVINIGDVWAKETKLKVFINGTGSQSYEYDVPILMPGEIWHTNVTHDFEGSYEVKVIADYYNDEAELNEGNNTVTKMVTAVFKEVNATLVSNVTTAKYGDMINLSVWLESRSPVGAFDLTLYYRDTGILRYVSSDTMENVSVSEGGWRWMNGMWFKTLLISGNDLNVNGTFLIANLTFQVGTDREVLALLNLSGDVKDVNGIRMVLNSTNATVQIEKYTDVYPYIWGYPSQVIEGDNLTFKVTVRNARGTGTNPIGLDVEIFNESNVRVWNESREIPPLKPWSYNTTKFTLQLPVGEYYIVAKVYNDSNTANNIAYSYNITVKKLEIDAWRLWYPYWKVVKNSTFTVFAYINSTAYVSGANITINVPEGLKVYNYSSGEWEQSYTVTGRILYENKWNYVRFLVKGVKIGQYGNGTDKEINITVEVRGRSDVINSTLPKETDWIPDYPLEIFVPSITLYSVNSTVLDANTTSSSMTFKTIDVNNVTTLDQNITIVVQAGQDGRILSGLDYLVHYPYGCVEQTTSAMLGALHVDWYYRDVAGAYPLGYNEDKVNRSVEKGVSDLAKGGTRGQHDNGSWSMWGWNPRGDGFYTMYASYGLGRVAEDTKYEYLVEDNLTEYHSASDAPGKFNFNDTIYWFAQSAKRDETTGAIWWEPWQGTHWFFDGHLPVTAWIMVAHYQLVHEGLVNQSAMDVANQTMANVTKYLVSVQNSDGGWNQWGDKDAKSSDAISTALAVWGLKLYGTPSEDVNETQIENAINRGIEWLLNNTHSVGADKVYWKHPLQSPWWDDYGRKSEATAYALIAMNESRSMFLNSNNFTVLDSTNETVAKGVNYLVSVYRAHGSFGYTAATQAALHALTLLQVVPVEETTLDITIDGVVSKTVRVNSTSPIVKVELNTTEINQINSNGELQDSKRRIHTVEVSRTSGNAFVIVSVENEQTVARNEITWGKEYRGHRILQTGEEGTIKINSLDSSILAETQNELTIAVNLPDDMVENNTYEFRIRIDNNNETAMISPIVKVELSGAKFNESGAKWYDSELGQFSFTQANMNASSDGYTVEFFPDQIPPEGHIEIVFNADVEENSANVSVDVSVTPMYAETQTFIASATKSVTGYGYVNLRVFNVSGSQIDAIVTVDGSSSTTSVKALEGRHRISVSKAGYVPVEFTVDLARGDNITYAVVLAEPEELETPRVLFAQVNSFTELENSMSVLSDVSITPNATVKAQRDFSLSVTGDGEKIIAVRMPKLERGSLWAWLNDSVSVDVGGQSVTPDEITIGDEKVLLIKVGGSASVNVSFEGRMVGDIPGTPEGVDIADAMFIAQYDVGVRNFDTKALVYGDIPGTPEGVDIADAMFVAQYDVGLRNADYLKFA